MTQQISIAQHSFSAPRALLQLGIAIVSAVVILAGAGIATSLWLRPVVIDGEWLTVAVTLIVFVAAGFVGMKLKPMTVVAVGLIQAAYVVFSHAAGLSGLDAPLTELSTVLGSSGLSMLSVGTAAVLLTLGFGRLAQSRSTAAEAPTSAE